MGETNFSLYNDIQTRTNGEIYIGVTGPVRTGKSTFIKGFMEKLVLPLMDGGYAKTQTVDELPQSAQGRTIMTTEPKFIPKEQIKITLDHDVSCYVRLVDCVGFLVPGAFGAREGDQSRMVKTPWFPQEIPFEKAAYLGTEKVIKDHATIGLVITCDGTFGELDRQAFLEAEAETVGLLRQSKKPFLMILNSAYPNSEEARQTAKQMEAEYGCAVIPLDCKNMEKADALAVLQKILYEFPVSEIDFCIPKWVEMLEEDHEIKKSIAIFAKRILGDVTLVKDIWNIDLSQEETYLSEVRLEKVDLATGKIQIQLTLDESYYYENISRLAGISIQGEYQLLSLVKRLSALRKHYEKVAGAMRAVEQKGYGVVTPELGDITMDEPEVIRHGNKYGVKMKAHSPSIHMIRANIETEIAPIVGSEQQALDLIGYIKEGQSKEKGVFDTNIFGKSVGELVEDGIRSKIATMDDECQLKLQDTMQKIVNDNNGGLVCIII